MSKKPKAQGLELLTPEDLARYQATYLNSLQKMCTRQRIAALREAKTKIDEMIAEKTVEIQKI